MNRTSKQTVLYSYDGILESKKNEPSFATSNNADAFHKHWEKETRHKMVCAISLYSSKQATVIVQRSNSRYLWGQERDCHREVGFCFVLFFSFLEVGFLEELIMFHYSMKPYMLGCVHWRKSYLFYKHYDLYTFLYAVILPTVLNNVNFRNFPGGPEVKNPPSNAGDFGLDP